MIIERDCSGPMLWRGGGFGSGYILAFCGLYSVTTLGAMIHRNSGTRL